MVSSCSCALLLVLLLGCLAGLGKGDGEAEAYYENEQEGEATYYGETSAGNCGIVPRPSWFSSLSFGVALNNVQYISGDQSQGCGLCVRGTYNAADGGSGATPPPASFTALVIDRCPECARGDLDLATAGDGRWPITWEAIDCPVGDTNLQYLYEGSNAFYIKIGVRNHKIGVVTLELQFPDDGSTFYPTERTQDNFFLCPTCPFPISGPFNARITGVNGQVLIDSVPSVIADGLLNGGNNVQFSDFSPSPSSSTPTPPTPTPPTPTPSPPSPSPPSPSDPSPSPPSRTSGAGTLAPSMFGLLAVVGWLLA